MPHRLRRRGDQIWGLRELQGRDLWKTQRANRQARSALGMIRRHIDKGGSGHLENPKSSLFWHLVQKALAKQQKKGICRMVKCDMCAYGTPWKKPTSLLVWAPESSSVSLKCCTGKQGLCSRTGLPHEQLSSSDSCVYAVKDGKCRTAFGQVYPKRFISSLLSQLVL